MRLPAASLSIGQTRLVAACPGGSDSHFFEYFFRRAEAVDARGNAAVNRDLQEDLFDVFLCQSVRHGGLDVQSKLMRAVERRDHRQIDEASRLALQSRPAPDLAPAVLSRQLLDG